jgi:hypothetical protein
MLFSRPARARFLDWNLPALMRDGPNRRGTIIRRNAPDGPKQSYEIITLRGYCALASRKVFFIARSASTG